ncbi:hypothetical protein [uncultured Roseibium sp.]|uniref:hypothetical protein n=2 Tax=uncultured Roseibium sp. TaxID=1936171 RepID=UPI0026232E7A|nr:hypothetical protein [uncultured Roseibium sp.]
MLKVFCRFVRGTGYFVLAMLVLMSQSALACQNYRAVNLADALSSGGVFIGEIIAESSIQDGKNSSIEHRLHVDIKEILHSHSPLPESIVLHFHSREKREALRRNVRYVYVVWLLDFDHPAGSGNKTNILMTALCGGHVPYIFDEESDAGRAIKQIFADDGFDRETKAKILSRFVGLYGQGF